VTLLLGDAGTGKSSLLRAVLSELEDAAVDSVLITNPTLTRLEFCEAVAQGLGLSGGVVMSKAQFLADLRRHLEGRFAEGAVTNLVIDEAQSLPDALLEEVRLLGNLETTTAHLLNIVLAGQPELAARLNEPHMRPLKQRISLRCGLTALTAGETAAYIAGRLRVAGGSPADVFTREAVIAIHEVSSGIPRTINVVCDNVLIGGYAAQVKPISVRIVEEVCRDFDLPFGGEPPQPLEDTPNGARQGNGRVQARRPDSRTEEPQPADADGASERGGNHLFEAIGLRRWFFRR
jgi:general secretion pathway protein A